MILDVNASLEQCRYNVDYRWSVWRDLNKSTKAHLSAFQIMRLHPNSSPSALKKTCPECGKVFTSLGGYRIHINSHRGIFPFNCSECSRGFTTKRAYTEHMRHHTNVDYFKCQQCNITFPTEYKMKLHRREQHNSILSFSADKIHS